MSITIESDLKEILIKIDQKLDNLQKDVTDLKIEVTSVKGEIKTLDEKLTGQIKALDEKLTGQIKTLDEKLTGQNKTLDTKVDGLSTRLQNQEFTSRAILISLVLVILGGAARMFGFVPPLP
jgi:predicted nuclease with TOPRIM domain